LVLKKVKKQICIENFENWDKISEIAKRFGCSEHYVKENFLRNKDSIA
jgi:AraC-like DNA-binding protein